MLQRVSPRYIIIGIRTTVQGDLRVPTTSNLKYDSDGEIRCFEKFSRSLAVAMGIGAGSVSSSFARPISSLVYSRIADWFSQGQSRRVYERTNLEGQRFRTSSAHDPTRRDSSSGIFAGVGRCSKGDRFL